MAQQTSTISKMETIQTMAQQTAVDWLIRNVNENIVPMYIPKQVVEQAKQMEKEQIKEAYCKGDDNIGAEQYYNETYNK